MPSDVTRDRDRAEQTTLDIVIPVYNEGLNIIPVLTALDAALKTPARVLICYDFEEDDTLVAIREQWRGALPVSFVRNPTRGAHSAVMTGLRHGTAPYALVFPADDDYNVVMLDAMVEKAVEGNDIVCASRFMPGGSMVGCPWLKAFLVRSAAFTLYWVARVPTHDATNGFRLFSRRVIERIPVESTEGFTYSLEWLVKTHRLRWPIAEVPARWMERQHGQSRFKVLRWIPAYMRWYAYAFGTTFARRLPQSVKLNHGVEASGSGQTAS
jgi:glycosyltransferase involved in cell wall biosynthesis